MILLDRGDSGENCLLVDKSPLDNNHGKPQHQVPGALVTIIVSSSDRRISTKRAVTAKLLVDGGNTKEIAERRSVSPETVKSLITSVLRKTNNQGRSDIIRKSVVTILGTVLLLACFGVFDFVLA